MARIYPSLVHKRQLHKSFYFVIKRLWILHPCHEMYVSPSAPLLSLVWSCHDRKQGHFKSPAPCVEMYQRNNTYCLRGNIWHERGLNRRLRRLGVNSCLPWQMVFIDKSHLFFFFKQCVCFCISVTCLYASAPEHQRISAHVGKQTNKKKKWSFWKWRFKLAFRCTVFRKSGVILSLWQALS